MPESDMRDVRLNERISFSSVSWGAIWAGAMLTTGMEFLFLSFGIFIGGVFGGSTAWTMAWYLITMAISFFIGAWGAARLSGAVTRENSVLHGLTTWGLATLGTGVIGGAVSSALMTHMEHGPFQLDPVEPRRGVGRSHLGRHSAELHRRLPGQRKRRTGDQRGASGSIRAAASGQLAATSRIRAVAAASGRGV